MKGTTKNPTKGKATKGGKGTKVVAKVPSFARKTWTEACAIVSDGVAAIGAHCFGALETGLRTKGATVDSVAKGFTSTMRAQADKDLAAWGFGTLKVGAKDKSPLKNAATSDDRVANLLATVRACQNAATAWKNAKANDTDVSAIVAGKTYAFSKLRREQSEGGGKGKKLSAAEKQSKMILRLMTENTPKQLAKEIARIVLAHAKDIKPEWKRARLVTK